MFTHKFFIVIHEQWTWKREPLYFIDIPPVTHQPPASRIHQTKLCRCKTRSPALIHGYNSCIISMESLTLILKWSLLSSIQLRGSWKRFLQIQREGGGFLRRNARSSCAFREWNKTRNDRTHKFNWLTAVSFGSFFGTVNNRSNELSVLLPHLSGNIVRGFLKAHKWQTTNENEMTGAKRQQRRK